MASRLGGVVGVVWERGGGDGAEGRGKMETNDATVYNSGVYILFNRRCHVNVDKASLHVVP